MAKQVQLKQNGQEIYPQTITQAIADTTKGKLLSTIITELYSGITNETALRIAAINALDLATVSGTGQYIKTITQTDGQVSATLGTVAASEVTNSSNKPAISGATDVQAALNALADKAAAQELIAGDKSIVVGESSGKTTVAVNIKSGEGVLKLDANNGLYTDLDLVKITESLPATVKERYQLLDSDNNQIGTNIDIPKDSHIVSITYITDSGDTHYQELEYKYVDASGNTQTTYVDLKSMLIEPEFASGVTVTDGIAHGVVDTASEKDSQATPQAFLTVGADGFKVSGIKDEIDRKINALNATKSGETAYINVQVTEAAGKITDVAVTNQVATDFSAVTSATTALADAKAIKDYVDSKTGALDSSVTGTTSDGYITFVVNQQNGALSSASITATTQNVSAATSSNNGLAEAYDVKTYVDGEIDALNATVSGQSGAVKVQVVEASGVVTNVAVTATTTSMADVTASTPADNLAKAKDVKDYVDSAITKTAIVDSADIDATSAATGTTLAINYQQVVSGGTKAVKSGDIFAWGVTAEVKSDVAEFTWPNA